MNDLLKKKGGLSFGNYDQTISYALGRNQQLDTLSKGVDKHRQFGRRRVVSELSEWVAVNYYRTGLLTESQSSQFVIDTEVMIYHYLEFSSSSFITWLSAVDGFATKDYYSEGLKNELISIYYGNY